ncbi:hypothetical protein BH09SUM1_BH09SUM1_32900 [soil metagenome]
MKPIGANQWKAIASRAGAVPIGDGLRKILICPDDDAPLDYLEQLQQFVCPGCARIYKEEDGVLSILPSSDPYRLSDSERAELERRGPKPPRAEEDPVWQQCLSVLGPAKGRQLLDLCCGSGWAAERFASLGFNVTATDIAIPPAPKSPFPPYIQSDVCRLPFASESFDVVFVSAALHEMKRPERMAKEIGRILKRDAVLLNIGEPFSLHSESGRCLTAADYAGIYREGGIDIRAVFPGDPIAPRKGFVQQIRERLRANSSDAERILVGKITPDFQLPSLRWRKRDPADG